jgi:hypothetical protein
VVSRQTDTNCAGAKPSATIALTEKMKPTLTSARARNRYGAGMKPTAPIEMHAASASHAPERVSGKSWNDCQNAMPIGGNNATHEVPTMPLSSCSRQRSSSSSALKSARVSGSSARLPESPDTPGA